MNLKPTFRTFAPAREDVARCISGFLRSDPLVQPSGDAIGITNGKSTYLALSNATGPLAVYRKTTRGWSRLADDLVPEAVKLLIEGGVR